MGNDIVRTKKIHDILAKLYPNSKTALDHTNALEMLVATILSAQCTDKRVNLVTPALFKRYPNAKAFASAKLPELEKMIHSTGFYKAKAKNIIGCCKGIVSAHGGEVPRSLDELVKLPGVGRKTANVVLGAIWGVPGVVVDTHVKRLSNLLGLTKNDDPEKIEADLMKLLPKKYWYDFSTYLIYHGRNVCIARRPKCGECALCRLCPSCEVKK